MKLLKTRLARFCFVGAAGTVVNLAVLVLLVHFFGVHPPLAFVVALETSIVSNFFMNHFFTFRVTHPEYAPETPTTMAVKLAKYNLIALAGAGISFLVFYGLYRWGLHYVLSDLLAIAAATAWNYYMSVKVVWKLVDE